MVTLERKTCKMGEKARGYDGKELGHSWRDIPARAALGWRSLGDKS